MSSPEWNDDAEVPEAGMDVIQQYDDQRKSEGSRRRRTALILIGIGLLAAAIGIGIAFATAGKQSPPVSSPSLASAGTSPPTAEGAAEVNAAIMAKARQGGAEFGDPNSYQSKALTWVKSVSLPAESIPLSLEEQAVQLYALACIYYNTYSTRSAWTDFHFGSDVAIPGWYNARGWLDDPNDVCDWYGITCNSDGHVEKIELDTNGLTGYFPPEVALLHGSLKYIDLFNNLVHNKGDLGNSFLGELTNLEYLFYGSTSFEYDGVPTEIGRLSNLKEYDFSYSLYFGDIEGDFWSGLESLNYLVMDGNSYNSSLPTELIALPELQFLYVGFSYLEGDLEFIKDMPNIKELWLDDNPGLSGTIPTSIGQAETLASFSATNCGLSGTIPTEFGSLGEMLQVWVYDNDLTGPIPTEMGSLVKLKILDVQKNELTGDMPQQICARRDPFGRLTELEADCDGEISCPDDCCTCCGEDCID